MSGADNYEYLINCSLGKIEDRNFTIDSGHAQTCSVLKFFDTPKNGGTVTKIDGLEFLEHCPNIDTFELNFDIGSNIAPAADDSKRIGFYIAHAENRDKLCAFMNEIDSTFKIHVK